MEMYDRENEQEKIERIREDIGLQIDFEQSSNEISKSEYNSAIERAVHYRGIKRSDAEIYLDQAISVIGEVQKNFENSITDQLQRAEMITNSVSGNFLENEFGENQGQLEEIVRFINIENPDLRAANELVDQAALKIGKVFKALNQAEEMIDNEGREEGFWPEDEQPEEDLF